MGGADAGAPVVVGHSFGSCVALELTTAWWAAGTLVRGVKMMN